MRDEHVDRRQVEVWQHMEPSRTNRPSGLTHPSIDKALHCTDARFKGSEAKPSALFPLYSCLYWLPSGQLMTVAGGNSVGVTPVPIPNTAVKPHRANGTAGLSGGRVRRRQLHIERPPCLQGMGVELFTGPLPSG